jgi:hypothetical protein
LHGGSYLRAKAYVLIKFSVSFQDSASSARRPGRSIATSPQGAAHRQLPDFFKKVLAVIEKTALSP